MAEVKLKTSAIFVRNRLGQFAEACDDAATETVRETIERGARTSRALAPAGKNRARYADRPNYVPLKRSIKTRMISSTKGEWYSIAPHWSYIEFGTPGRTQTGFYKFVWDARGQWFYWNNPFYGPIGSGKEFENWTYADGVTVRIPPQAARPFLRPAYEAVVAKQMMEIAKKHFPG